MELATVIFALQICRYYLYEVSFQLFTDHKSMKYFFMHKDMNNRHHKWLEFLADYDIDVAYSPAKVNVMANTLSRRVVACGAKLTAMGI